MFAAYIIAAAISSLALIITIGNSKLDAVVRVVSALVSMLFIVLFIYAAMRL